MANINGYLSSINRLNGDIACYKSGIASAQRQIKTLNQRKYQVSCLICDLTNVANIGSSEINEQLQKARQSAGDSIKGTMLFAASDIEADLTFIRESGMNSDSEMTEAKNHLRREEDRINDEINRLNSQISNYNSKIAEAQNSIAANKRAAASECRNSASRANSEYVKAKRKYENDPTPENKAALNRAAQKKDAENRQYNQYSSWS